MDKKNKKIIWLLLMIFCLALITMLSAYAFFTAKEYRYGNLDIDVTSNGVDTLQINRDKDLDMVIKAYEFNKNYVGDSEIQIILDTSFNESNKYCYTINVDLPEEPVFSYSNPGSPELLMTVSKSIDGKVYEPVIENFDATVATGNLEVPTSKDSYDYINEIQTTKNVQRIDYWRVTLKFIYYPDPSIDQSKNFMDKSYHAELKAKRVDC